MMHYRLPLLTLASTRLPWLHRSMIHLVMAGSLLTISLASLGCTPTASDTLPFANSPMSVAASPASRPMGQSLPISATAIIAGKPIKLEVARTVQEQSTGLMYRPSLPDDRGMLFPFDPPMTVSFWMKNVQIPLDMVFMRQGKVLFIAANVPPCQSDPCPVYGPGVPIDNVIELRGGRAKELGIQIGDFITIQHHQN
ncbi:MAG: DUF192 domain-containing protein [Cyanobacteria bacterium]|nr:DUF192 domain-containing protein [Cyanobacteriota bacterium]MDW8200053.1 DUF192 domain-containing protein [Cyanobacteriota bacterium SKYGB_h_bin112]